MGRLNELLNEQNWRSSTVHRLPMIWPLNKLDFWVHPWHSTFPTVHTADVYLAPLILRELYPIKNSELLTRILGSGTKIQYFLLEVDWKFCWTLLLFFLYFFINPLRWLTLIPWEMTLNHIGIGLCSGTVTYGNEADTNYHHRHHRYHNGDFSIPWGRGRSWWCGDIHWLLIGQILCCDHEGQTVIF